jgi:hypothetical protein
LEMNHKKRNKALFQLRGRLQRANISHPNDAFEAEVTAELIEEITIPSAECEASKDPQGNRKLCALFDCRRTHNEQIFVRPCGMIVAQVANERVCDLQCLAGMSSSLNCLLL